MELQVALEKWDGKSAVEIQRIYQQFHRRALFVDSLVALVDSPLQTGATRLIKCHVDSGERLSIEEQELICQHIPALVHWESRLHMLQILPRLVITSECRADVEDFLRSAVVDENRFVRAWAYSGFYLLATQYPEYRDEVRKFYLLALRDESASVTARLRQSLKHDEWMRIDP